MTPRSSSKRVRSQYTVNTVWLREDALLSWCSAIARLYWPSKRYSSASDSEAIVGVISPRTVMVPARSSLTVSSCPGLEGSGKFGDSRSASASLYTST